MAKVKRSLEKGWEVEKRKKNPNFAWTMFRTQIKHWLVPLGFFMVCVSAQSDDDFPVMRLTLYLAQTTQENFIYIVQPLMLGIVIRYFNGDSTVSKQMAWLCIGGINGCMLCTIALDHPMIQVAQRLGCRWRVAASALIYQKALKLSRASVGQTAASQITNILANDANRFDEFAGTGMYLLIAPVQTCVIMYIAWTYLGVSSIVGLVCLLLFIPFQSLMGKLFSQVRLRTALLTDSRLKYMNEIISGMRVLKCYCWERPFAKRIAEVRK